MLYLKYGVHEIVICKQNEVRRQSWSHIEDFFSRVFIYLVWKKRKGNCFESKRDNWKETLSLGVWQWILPMIFTFLFRQIISNIYEKWNNEACLLFSFPFMIAKLPILFLISFPSIHLSLPLYLSLPLMLSFFVPNLSGKPKLACL